jgi:chromosome partitioning protein
MVPVEPISHLSHRLTVGADAEVLARNLEQHRLASFPPSASKTFRRLGPAEAATILGITESFLRVSSSALPAFSGHERTKRLYSLEDIAELREILAKKSRKGKGYVPTRRPGEHLQIISVMNFKGGSGKTTTSIHLAQYLALHGYRVLAIDLDPQASLTSMLGVRPEIDVPPNGSLYGALRYDDGRVPIAGLVRKTYIPGLSLIPASLELVEFEHETPRNALQDHDDALGGTRTFSRIDNALQSIADDYDVVLVDCPPQLGYITLSALVATTSILITIHPQMLDVMSMNQFLAMMADLLDVIYEASGTDPAKTDWYRYLPTRFEPGDGPQNQVVALLRSMFGERVLNQPVLKSTAISDAGLTGETLYEVDRSKFTRSTYDRALDSINAVNAEIEGLIRQAWGRK